MRVGDVEITPLVDGRLVLQATDAYPTTTDADWEPHRRWLDSDGNVDMPIGCFLIRTGARTILVDCGLGPYDFGAFTGGRLLEELRNAGVTPADVTDVVCTHLHFDHVGWATQKGAVVFENATYRWHSADTEHFGTDERSVRKLSPLSDRLALFDGQTTLAPGVDTLPTPGHTPGHTALVVSAPGERVILLGDAVHCPAELSESEWDGMGDVDPVLARRTRERLLTELEASQDPVAGAHLPGLAFGRIARAEGRRTWVV